MQTEISPPSPLPSPINIQIHFVQKPDVMGRNGYQIWNLHAFINLNYPPAPQHFTIASFLQTEINPHSPLPSPINIQIHFV